MNRMKAKDVNGGPIYHPLAAAICPCGQPATFQGVDRSALGRAWDRYSCGSITHGLYHGTVAPGVSGFHGTMTFGWGPLKSQECV